MAEMEGSGREFFALSRTALQAFGAVAPKWVQSLFGDWRSWRPPHREDSEFAVVDPFQPLRLARFLVEASVPWVWKPTQIFRHPDPRGDFDAHPDEAWFFINGVLTNREIAEANARLIAKMFHRPLTVVHNSTNSLPVDILESAVGKAWRWMTEPARVAYPVLLEALKDRSKERVVVVCHSQGTIIMANLMRALDKARFRRWLFSRDAGASPEQADRPVPRLPRKKRLAKLEVYAFANCADRMTYAARPTCSKRDRRVPWIENFANEFDSVARLGMLARGEAARGIQIDGDRYVRNGAWGHLLNQHYLFPILDHLSQPGGKQPFPASGANAGGPRLYEYFAGGRPPAY